MKNLTIILVVILCNFNLVGQSISEIEYYIGDVDPGVGLGTSYPVLPQTSINETLNIEISALPIGLHKLNIRVRDNDLWSLTHTSLFFALSSTLPLIKEIEYFVDTDPGFGQGTSIDIENGSPVNTNFLVNTSALSPGIHTLQVRMLDENNRWSLTHASPFFVLANTSSNLMGFEYFIDSDPGFGNGSFHSATPSASLDEGFNIATSALSNGMHILNIRTVDSGNAWSLTHSIPFFSITNDAVNLVELEYFIDNDPGFGNGTSIAIAPSTSINIPMTADLASTQPGLHVFHARTKDASGSWSVVASHPFYIVSPSNTNISGVEYFFDVDPGFGNATSILITPGSSINPTFLVDVSNVTPGLHILNVRVRDEEGVWSLAHAKPVFVLPEGGAEIVEAEYFIDADPGVGNATGITITSGSIVSPNFNVDTQALSAGGHILNIRTRDSNGSWSITSSTPFIISKEAENIVLIEYAIDTDPGVGNGNHILIDPGTTIDDNIIIPLDGISDGEDHKVFVRAKTSSGVWGLTEIVFFEVCNLLPPVVTTDYISTKSARIEWNQIPLATSYKLDVSDDNFQSFLTGYEDKVLTDTFEIVMGLTPGGQYQVRLRTEGYCLSDYSDTTSITTYEQTIPTDSTALVDFFNSTNGNNWTNNDNWLQTPVVAWHGITVVSQRATKIELANNNLSGEVPFNISSLSALTTINLSGNNLIQLPPLDAILTLTDVQVQNNKLTFEDIDDNVGIAGFIYSPQQDVGEGDTITLTEEDPLILSYEIGGTGNTYQWQRDEINVDGETSNNLSRIVTLDDNGLWRLKTVNDSVPGLEIFTTPVNVRVYPFGIVVDSIALVALYQSTGGSSWVRRNGWLTGKVSTWAGVTVVDNRVTSLDLSNNNLQGVPSQDFTNLLEITSINLSGNALTSLPDFTNMATLTSLDVSNNRLQFGSLEPNLSVPGFNYSNQAAIGNPATFEVRVKESHNFSVNVTGSNNIYKWKLNGALIPGATTSTYEVQNVTKQTMGDYTCEITSNIVADLTLTLPPQKIIAVADISGKLFHAANAAATAGSVTLFKITQTGGYDTVLIKNIAATGFYIFENIPLDNYQILGYASTVLYPRALPTYYGNTLFWEEASTLIIDSVTVDRNITSQLSPLETPVGLGSISGTVFEEVVDESGRVNARTRVKGAGVSVRRTERSGRGKDELVLVDYQLTDNEGEFEFIELPQDDYLLNIQYPGYPMDPNSDINIGVGTDYLADKKIEAVVEEGKIKVTELIITGVWNVEGYHAVAFPNPAGMTTTIEFANASKSRAIKVFDLAGKNLILQDASSEKTIVDFTGYAKGVYMVNILEEEKIVKVLKVELR